MAYKTEQENFWASQEWGREYIKRNNKELITNNIALFGDILKSCTPIKSVLEFGSNIGLNLQALHTLFDSIELSAIEINKTAVEELNKQNFINKVYHDSILDFPVDYQRDFVLIKGVLIHINPKYLDTVYKKLYNASNRYILIAEYYNPTPVSINYRGHENRLFKRDFAGEMLEKYNDLELVNYGFIYHKDNNFPQDDITWFLLKKRTK